MRPPKRVLSPWAIILLNFLIITLFFATARKSVEITRRLVADRYEGSLSQYSGLQTLIIAEVRNKTEKGHIDYSDRLGRIRRTMMAAKEDAENIASAKLHYEGRIVHVERETDKEALRCALDPAVLDGLTLPEMNLAICSVNSYGTNASLCNADTDYPPRSYLVVPTQLVFKDSRQRWCLSNQIKKEIVFSKIIESDLLALLDSLPGMNMCQAYFIPSSGLLRIVNNRDPDIGRYYANRISAKQNFADRTYYQQTLDQGFRVSSPYIDTGGFGVIVTYSIAVDNRQLGIQGIIGLDRQIEPIKNALNSINLGLGTRQLGAATVKYFRYDSMDSQSSHVNGTHSEAWSFLYRYIMQHQERIATQIVRIDTPDTGDITYTVPVDKEEFAIIRFNLHRLNIFYRGLFAIYALAILGLTVIYLVYINVRLQKVRAQKATHDIVEGMKAGYMIVDDGGIVRAHNQELADMLEISRLLPHSSYRDVLTDESCRQYDYYKTRLAGRFEFPAKVRRKDGSLLSTIIMSAPLGEDRASRLNLVIPALSLEQAVAEKYVHGFSHALKTPLHSVMLTADLFRRKSARPKYDYYYNIIKNEIGGFSKNITRLLAFSKLELEGMKPVFVKSDVSGLVQSVFDGNYERARENKVRMNADIAHGVKMEVDSNLITMTLEILVDNAIKYTPSGEIVMRLYEGAEGIRIEVQDTGIGIRKDEQERVFEKCFRGSHPAVQQSDGVGIGLFLAKSFVELHGGVISVESEPGKGSLFVIRLPRKRSTE